MLWWLSTSTVVQLTPPHVVHKSANLPLGVSVVIRILRINHLLLILSNMLTCVSEKKLSTVDVKVSFRVDQAALSMLHFVARTANQLHTQASMYTRMMKQGKKSISMFMFTYDRTFILGRNSFVGLLKVTALSILSMITCCVISSPLDGLVLPYHLGQQFHATYMNPSKNVNNVLESCFRSVYPFIPVFPHLMALLLIQ